ncbi:MAG TPA: acyl-CoA reductase [Chitinophagaceae bacterium]
MQLDARLDLLTQLQSYMLGNDAGWEAEKEEAYRQNGWFIPQFIDLAVRNIATHLLSNRNLQRWIEKYRIPQMQNNPKSVGIVMPGNIPLSGFHDFLVTFLSGHRQRIMLSSKDDVLLKHLVGKMASRNESVNDLVSFEEMLKGCDAYIARSNQPHGSMEQYLSKYPHIIHRATGATAILSGHETRQQLELLADDVFQYFGQGNLSVNKIYVPQQYDFIPLLKVFEKYNWLVDHNKYKNNYDYQLSLLILNKEFYMTNGAILLTSGKSPISPVARLNYEYYSDEQEVLKNYNPDSGQFLVGTHQAPFGRAQQSVIYELEGPATLQFLLDLSKN